MSDDLDRPQSGSTTLNAGWRPYSGWTVCVGGVGYALIGHPILGWIMQMVAVLFNRPIPSPAQLDTTLLLELFLILIGYRTIEKYNGVASK